MLQAFWLSRRDELMRAARGISWGPMKDYFKRVGVVAPPLSHGIALPSPILNMKRYMQDSGSLDLARISDNYYMPPFDTYTQENALKTIYAQVDIDTDLLAWCT